MWDAPGDSATGILIAPPSLPPVFLRFHGMRDEDDEGNSRGKRSIFGSGLCYADTVEFIMKMSLSESAREDDRIGEGGGESDRCTNKSGTGNYKEPSIKWETALRFLIDDGVSSFARAILNRASIPSRIDFTGGARFQRKFLLVMPERSLITDRRTSLESKI